MSTTAESFFSKEENQAILRRFALELESVRVTDAKAPDVTGALKLFFAILIANPNIFDQHCADWDSARFLRWVEGEGGPAHGHGLREELLSQKMSSVMQRLTPTEAYPDESARVIAEVERREVGRAEQAEWFERFAYLHADDGYFDLVDRRQYSRGNFNAIYRHVACYSIHASANGKKRKVEASISFDENRQAMGAKVLQGVTYAPGESVLVARDGDVYGNRWRDARPEVSAALRRCRSGFAFALIVATLLGAPGINTQGKEHEAEVDLCQPA